MIPLPPMPLLDGNTLLIDNSRLEAFTRCPRSAEYAVVRKRISADEKAALVFGSAAHIALKYRYSRFGGNEMSEEGKTRQYILLEKFYEHQDVPLNEYRTLGYAQELMYQYNNHYRREDFYFVQDTGKNLVESPFAIPLGKVGDINVVWTGRIDGAIIRMDGNGRIYVLDHKTSSMGGDNYFSEYYTSSQMKGYVFALQRILNAKVWGVIVNALFVRRQTRTGKGIEFGRQRIDFDEGDIEDWQTNTMRIVEDFIHCNQRLFFPRHTTQCIGKFGKCQFHDVCTLSGSSQLSYLYTAAYKDDKWSPLHDDDIDLDMIDRMEIPANYKRQAATPNDAEVDDLINQLMNL